jgi:chemotaxis protein MotB
MVFAMTRMTAPERETVMAGMESTVASREARADAERTRLREKQTEEEAILKLNAAVADGALRGRANISVSEQTVQITLNPQTFFSTGSAALNPDAVKALENLAGHLRQFPSENDVIIEGHTDNVPVGGGPYRSNWELSVARAVSVIDFFTSRGLSPGRLVAGGYGEYHPAHPNDSEENRARNRRIEISIIRQQGGGF